MPRISRHVCLIATGNCHHIRPNFLATNFHQKKEISLRQERRSFGQLAIGTAAQHVAEFLRFIFAACRRGAKMRLKRLSKRPKQLALQLAGNELSRPPRSDEVEVSVFGPGFGECIVVHIGANEWIVADSCVNTESKPVALEYLKRIGVDIATDVVIVAATHWHDDHIRGLGELFEACKHSRFACSTALNNQEWAALVEIYRGSVLGSGLVEMGRIMAELKRRSNRGAIIAPAFCLTGRVLLERNDDITAKITCLAPSDAAVATMQTRIREELMPKAKARRLCVPALGQNDSSVVISIRVGETSVLLGADLEEKRREGIGWQVILDGHPVNGDRFDGLKVPHHGSKTGYHPDIWSKLMLPEAWAAVTPFNRLSDPLPTASDCERILNSTESAFITAPPGLGKFKHADRSVERAMREATIGIGAEPGKQGHVRFRKASSPASGEWSVELYGHAMRLRSLWQMLS
jgi:beta-lactamase superfamily II metal-dependent hydrolase